jgi:hypothetical protein
VYFAEKCGQVAQYSDGEQAYWVINGKRVRHLNGQTHMPDGEEVLLPLPTTSDINTKYAIEISLPRKVKVQGIVLNKQVNIYIHLFRTQVHYNLNNVQAIRQVK